MLKCKRIYKLGLIISSLWLISVTLTPVNGDTYSIGSTPVWEITFGTPNEDIPTQMLSATDGGYILTGSYIKGDATQSTWLSKVDSEGNEEWNKSYSNPTKPQGHIRSIVNTSDGGYAFTGFVYNTSEYTSWDLWVLKTDENGTEQWNRTYNGWQNGPDYGSQIAVASDGGFLISGATQSQYALPTENWNTDYWLIKTDANGMEEWNKTYHRVGSDQGTGLIPLDDGNYLLSGLSRQTSASNSAFSIWIIKIHENGTVIWDQAYDKGSDWYGAWERNLIGTSDGGFLLACYPFGSTYSVGKDYWIIKCDSNGNVEWNTTFGGDYYDTPTVCLQSSTGDYYIGGAYDSPFGNDQNGDMCIVRLNSTGTILGHITYGEVTWGEIIVDMVLTEESDSSLSIIALGSVETEGTGEEYRDFWLGKFPKVNEVLYTTTTTTTTTSTTTDTITPTTDGGTPYAGMLVLYLGLSVGVILRKRRKRNHEK